MKLRRNNINSHIVLTGLNDEPVIIRINSIHSIKPTSVNIGGFNSSILTHKGSVDVKENTQTILQILKG